jgi:uncharacterized protein with PQ loop repeat
MKHTFHPKHKIKRNDKIDTLALIVGIIQPLATLPQIYLVYSSQDASDVSLFMWAGFNIASVVLLIYGMKHKLAPIVWAQILWLIVQTPMMVSVFLFP